MCLIIVCPPGKTPDVELLSNATYQNPDGHGWAMRTPHGLETVRSAADIDRVWSTFWRCRERYPDGWAFWHSRLATHGTKTDENTHPYPVPGRPWLLAHNGILPLSDGPLSRRDRSDSRILAEDIIAESSFAELRAEQKRLEYWLQGDKVVILSADKEKGGSCLILNEGEGTWNRGATGDGCWYSRKTLYSLGTTTGGYYQTCWGCAKAWADCDCEEVITPHGTAKGSIHLSGERTAADAQWWQAELEKYEAVEAEEAERVAMAADELSNADR